MTDEATILPFPGYADKYKAGEYNPPLLRDAVQQAIRGREALYDEMPGFSWSANFEDLLTRVMRMHNAKATDYTAGNRDPLYNYRSTARLAGVPTHVLMLARLQEKTIRLFSLLSNGNGPAVKDESMEDTLLDIANIALLVRNDMEWAKADSAGREETING